MEIIVNEKMHRFSLAFDEWVSAVGHEIKVGDYRFCAITLSETINISEVTTGTKVLSIPITPLLYFVTETKKEFLEYLEENVGERLKRAIRRDENHFAEQLANFRGITLERLGKMPTIEKVGYEPCNKCGVLVDDGNMQNGVYLCHDCLS